MKGRLFLAGMLALALTFGLVLVGCDKDDDGGGGSSKGTLTLHNASTSATESITSVYIYKGTNSYVSSPVDDYHAPIAQAAKHSWSLDPGPYYVSIGTNTDNYQGDVFYVEAGKTTDVTYDGTYLR